MNEILSNSWLGIVAMLVVALSILSVIAKAPLGWDHTVSAHLAQDRFGYTVAAVALTFPGSIFFYFLINSIGPSYSAGGLYYLLVAACWIATLLTAVTKAPTVPKEQFASIHGVAAVCSALCLPLITLALALSSPSLQTWLAWVCVLASTGMLVIAFIYTSFSAVRRIVLFLELLYVGVFAAVILFLVSAL